MKLNLEVVNGMGPFPLFETSTSLKPLLERTVFCFSSAKPCFLFVAIVVVVFLLFSPSGYFTAFHNGPNRIKHGLHSVWLL